jgi:uncharacterized protein (DUF342 family)
MIIHKTNIKTGGAVCKAKDFNRSIVANQWLHVTCNNCKIIKRNVPKLKVLNRQLLACEKRLKELKKITQRYQNELTKASS